MTILSETAFAWVATLAIGVVASVWLVYDAMNLWKLRHADRSDPVVRDKVFGYLVGISVGLIGIVGVMRHGLP